MKRITYIRPDGGMSVVNPAINAGEKKTEAEAEKRAWDRLPKKADGAKFVSDASVPRDREFRDAWNSDFSIDMKKAKEIHAERIQLARKPMLEPVSAEAEVAVADAKTIKELTAVSVEAKARD